MNNTETIQKLKQMRLGAMAQLHDQYLKSNSSQECTPDEYLALLTDYEWEHRYNRKMLRLIKQAAFRQKATMAEVRYSEVRNLDKNMFLRLGALDFITKAENIIITGSAGVGKSYLAQALGHQGCIEQLKVQYTVTARLFQQLKLAKLDGTYLKELRKIAKVDLLILDDFGLQAFDNFSRETLLDIIDERLAKTSTIIASQLPVSAWYDIIGENTIADAFLDRIVNSSHRIDLIGESLRKGMINTQITKN